MATSLAESSPHRGRNTLLFGAGLLGAGALGWLLHQGTTSVNCPMPKGCPTCPPPPDPCPPTPSCECAYVRPEDQLWHCVLGQQTATPLASADEIMAGRLAWLGSSGQWTPAQLTRGWLPDACNVCWDRLPSGCASTC